MKILLKWAKSGALGKQIFFPFGIVIDKGQDKWDALYITWRNLDKENWNEHHRNSKIIKQKYKIKTYKDLKKSK